MSELSDELRNATAYQALDWHVDLIGFWRSERGKQFAAQFARSEAQSTGQLRNMSNWLSDLLANSLDQASTYWVSPDMQEMVIALAREQALPPVVEPHDVPTPHGFVIFDEPIVITDVHGRTVTWRALSWFPTQIDTDARGVADLDTATEIKEGVGIAIYTDMHLEREVQLDDYYKMEPEVYHRSGAPRFLLVAVGSIPYGEPRLELDEDMVALGPHQTLVAQAFWLLSQQVIAVRSSSKAPRALARRLERQGRFVGDLPEVIVITLRRATAKIADRRDEDEDGPGILWSHRWLVRGHWRKQPIGKRGSQQWKWVWVDTHVKGPDHLPFIAKDAVAKLVR